MTTFSRTCTVSALALGVALAFTSAAHAAAFQLKENSAKSLGRAFSGSTSAPDDASVVGSNPGAMRLLDGRQFQADLSVISFGAKFNGSARYLNGSGPAISGSNGGDAGKTAPIPAAYFHLPFGEDEQYHFGVSLHVPFGFATKYNRDWVGRYNGTKTELEAVDLGLAFSYDVTPYLSFGANVFVEHLSIELQSAVDFGTILAPTFLLGFVPGSHDGYSTLKGSHNQVGFTVGGLFSFTDHTHFGLSYRSQVKHKINDGKAIFDVPAAASSVLGIIAPNNFINTNARANVSLPHAATASFTHAINDRWSVMADLSHTWWKGSFNQVRVRFDSGQPVNVMQFRYQNTMFGSIGTEYRLNESVTLRGGFGYDQTPTSYQYRDVRVPDDNRKLLSLGLSWSPNENAEYNFGYTHLFVNSANVDTVTGAGNRTRGHFKVNGDVFAASVNYKF